MSILDSLKGAIYEDEPGPKKADPTATRKLTDADTEKPSSLPKAWPFTTTAAGPSDLRNTAEFLNFKSRIYPSSGPLSGFIATFESLKAAIPDEATRLTAAISVCEAQGRPVSGVLADIDLANQRLTTEKQNIEVARANKLNGEVATLEAQAKDLSAAIESKSKEIVELRSRQESLSENARISKTQIESKTKAYMAALSQIAADLDAMERKLKGVK